MDLRGLVMTATSMYAEHLNFIEGPPRPDKKRSEIDDFAASMDEAGMGAVVLRVNDDGNLVVPDDLPEPLARVMKEVSEFFGLDNPSA